ncbi:MAG TPA: hypothetical protein VFL91_17790, partial [Thermomicrobiales bacterium]|nr:hypothetical protein [Thermomicrobiales bacterium]
INVDARGFGLLDRRLDWQALGVTLPRGAALAFRPPRCGLLPDRYRLPLLRPAARAHAALHRYSYRFQLTETLFETPSYRWVPWRAFDAFEREFQAAGAALAAAQAALLADYPAVRAEVVALFGDLAAASARRLAATGHAAPEGFAERVVAGVLDHFPTEADIAGRLTLRYRVGVVLLGSEMVEEQRRARAARRALEEAEAATRLARRREAARERLVQRELWAAEERLRRQLAAEEEERRREAAVKERLRRLKLEAARERLKDELSPLEEGWRQLHARVYEAVVAIRDSLEKHGTLRGASARRARELARWVRLMNWQDDRQLAALLDELERLASRPVGARPRDPGPLADVLADIIALTHAGARAVAEPHRLDALEV